MRRFLLLAALLASIGRPAAARQVVDTMVVRLEPIIVEAERHSQQLADATSAISVIEPVAFEGFAVSTATDLFSMLPGLAFVSLDGTGHDAQAMVRGFFGGGDAEYVQVRLDGVPVNDIETGLVAWDLIDLHSLARVEILRGGSSSLYGDAAIGGVMNLYTARRPGRHMSGSLRYGSYATAEASARYSDTIGSRNFSVGGTIDRSDGYRQRASREIATVSAGADLLADGPVRGRVTVSSAWRDVQKPGPLTDSLFEASRTAVSPMFAHDRVDERRHSADISFRSATSASSGPSGLDWMLRAAGSIRDARDISTLALAADFADTQDRDLFTRSIGLSGQVTARNDIGKIVAGTDVSRSNLESTYYQFFTGSSSDYQTAGGLSRGDMLVAGEGSRTQLGAYVQAESQRFGPVAVTAGARVDRINDSYTPDGEAAIDNTHDAVSPKVGLNIEAIATPSYRVNVYASAGKSFKAPAIDQLFDQRQTPVPFPPFSVSISNGELKPQRGNNVEIGGYSQVLVPDRGRAELSVNAYQMDMRDELDFSFEEFRLINIGESRHRGVELAARYFDRGGVTGYATYAYQATTFRNGDNEGNYVKAVPRDVVDAGLSYEHASGFSAGLRYHGARRIPLDDQNTRRLDNTSRVDLHVGVAVSDARMVVEVFNVFDQADVSTGFPDPAGGEMRFLFPSAERYVKLGIEYRR